MIVELINIKGFMLLGVMLQPFKSQVTHLWLAVEPDFADDPVPGDSFPHHIFNEKYGRG